MTKRQRSRDDYETDLRQSFSLLFSFSFLSFLIHISCYSFTVIFLIPLVFYSSISLSLCFSVFFPFLFFLSHFLPFFSFQAAEQHSGRSCRRGEAEANSLCRRIGRRSQSRHPLRGFHTLWGHPNGRTSGRPTDR